MLGSGEDPGSYSLVVARDQQSPLSSVSWGIIERWASSWYQLRQSQQSSSQVWWDEQTLRQCWWAAWWGTEWWHTRTRWWQPDNNKQLEQQEPDTGKNLLLMGLTQGNTNLCLVDKNYTNHWLVDTWHKAILVSDWLTQSNTWFWLVATNLYLILISDWLIQRWQREEEGERSGGLVNRTIIIRGVQRQVEVSWTIQHLLWSPQIIQSWSRRTRPVQRENKIVSTSAETAQQVWGQFHVPETNELHLVAGTKNIPGHETAGEILQSSTSHVRRSRIEEQVWCGQTFQILLKTSSELHRPEISALLTRDQQTNRF